MNINGKEIGLRYTVGCAAWFAEYVNAHQDEAVISIYAKLMPKMNEAYVRTYGGETITEDEIMDMDFSEMMEVKEELEAIIKCDSKTTVEVAEPKGKKGKKNDVRQN